MGDYVVTIFGNERNLVQLDFDTKMKATNEIRELIKLLQKSVRIKLDCPDNKMYWWDRKIFDWKEIK